MKTILTTGGDPLRAALVELVACKALKDSAESESSAHERALTLDEYKRRQPLAWASARAALTTPQPSAPQATPPQPASPDVAKMVEEAKRLANQVSTAGFNAGVEDAGDAWTRQNKTAIAMNQRLAELKAAIEALGAAATQAKTAHPAQAEAPHAALQASVGASEQIEPLRRALEVIAVGDSNDPVRDAGDELVALGYWNAEALEQHRATAQQVAEASEDTAMLDWLTRHMRGSELRSLGIVLPAWSPEWVRDAIRNVMSPPADSSAGSGGGNG